MKELPPRETKDNKKTLKSFNTVGLSTPFPVYARRSLSTPFPTYAVHQTAHCPLLTVETLRLPEENNVSSAIAVPQRVVSIQYVDGAKGMLLRCLRFAENKLMSMRQIRMRENQISKNIQSFSTEPVLHDPAELFVHLCVSTCYSKR